MPSTLPWEWHYAIHIERIGVPLNPWEDDFFSSLKYPTHTPKRNTIFQLILFSGSGVWGGVENSNKQKPKTSQIRVQL